MYQALVTIDPFTLICQICNLLIQMYIVKRFLLDKVLAVLDERRRRADAEIAEAKQAKSDAAAIKSEYEKNMAEAKETANQLVADAQKTAAARGEVILSEARAQAAALKQKAEADIAQEKKKAVNEIKDEIGGIAMEIASKVVEREIRETDHKALIDEFIRNVGEAS